MTEEQKGILNKVKRMKEVHPSLFVGNEQDCVATKGNADWTIVHACKHPCHQNAVGYSGSLPSGHPDYLIHKKDQNLYLNMVDMDRKQKHEYMEPIVSSTLDFIGNYIDSYKVLVHCNEGESRAPALAMLYLAKRKDAIRKETYAEAKQDFQEIYSRFDPSRGINLYLQDYWQEL